MGCIIVNINGLSNKYLTKPSSERTASLKLNVISQTLQRIKVDILYRLGKEHKNVENATLFQKKYSLES